MKALGIDIGGSGVKAAPVDTVTGRLLAERHRVDTPKNLAPVKMAEIVGELVAHFHWHGLIGIGFPGVIHGARILTAANLD
ncbi:MAG: ROK family protein, partial [Opitutaceae bacterium]